jgi:hypothetical protein
MFARNGDRLGRRGDGVTRVAAGLAGILGSPDMDVACQVFCTTREPLASGQTNSIGSGQSGLGATRKRLGVAMAARSVRRDLSILQAGRGPGACLQ